MASGHSSFSTVYSYYLKNYYRSRSFYLIFILVVIVSALIVYLSIHYLPRIDSLFPTQRSIPEQLKERIVLYLWAYVMSDIPVFAAVFFASPAISSEIENKTAFHIFSLPIDRSILLLGKFTAAVTASVISVSVYIAAETLTLLYLFGGIQPIPFLASLAMLILFIAAVTAFTFLISSLFSKNLYSYITTFILYFIVFDSVNLILQLLYNYNAFFLLDNAASIIERIFINTTPSVFGSQLSINGAPFGSILESLLVMLGYIFLSLVVSLLIFERKEVK